MKTQGDLMETYLFMHDILAIVSYYNCFRDFILFFHHSPQYKQQNGSQGST